MTNKYEKQVGVILAQLACKDITLHQAAILAQEQLNLHKLDAYKAGMTEAAEIVGNIPHEGISPANEKVIEIRAARQAILSARDKKETI